MGTSLPWATHAGQSTLIPIRYMAQLLQLVLTAMIADDPDVHVYRSLPVARFFAGETLSEPHVLSPTCPDANAATCSPVSTCTLPKNGDRPVCRAWIANRSEFAVMLGLAITMNIIETGLVLASLSLYLRKLQMIQAVLHVAGCFFLLFFIMSKSHYAWFWYIYLGSTIAPFVMQVVNDVCMFWLRQV